MFYQPTKTVLFTSILLLQGTVTVRTENNPYCELECDFGFAKYSHTVCDRRNVNCGAAPECGPDFEEVAMTDDLKRVILDLHNDYRQKIAAGKETRAYNQPPAANMLQMIYNEELQNISRCWANSCKGNPLTHDHCRRTKYDEHVGQNLGFYNDSRANFDLQNITLQLIQFWFDEVLDFKPEWAKDTKDRSAQVVVGHYTQLVWADSLELGCAIVRYTTPNIHPKEYPPKWNHVILVCNYGPGGNYLGQEVYAEGPPCSQCPPHTHCGRDGRTNALCLLDYDTVDYDTVEKEQTQKELEQEAHQNANNKDLVQKFVNLFYS